MNFIHSALVRLADAARRQGEAPYNHRTALEAARIEERGEALMPIAAVWAAHLPNGWRTLGDWVEKETPTGLQAAEVFKAAAEETRPRP